jgi:predicted unusual protein kinase regulating ubiquinone biosynthesis (AarF/ABC1/UbiB family)
MSMDDTDLLPSELVAILAKLRTSGYAMPPKQLRFGANENWGLDWRKKFSSFDVRPFATASIGQVHKAILRDGRNVAIKVQFPNILLRLN